MAKRNRKTQGRAKSARRAPAETVIWPDAHGAPQNRKTPPSEEGDARRDAVERNHATLWIYGVHAAMAALANPRRTILRIVTSAQSGLDADAAAAAETAEAAGAPPRPKPEIRDRREIDALLPPHAVHQGIAVHVERLAAENIETLCPAPDDDASRPRRLIVVLDQATDPQNIGAVIRSAAAFGALGVVVHDRHTPDITGAMAKAASGGVEQVPLVRVTNLARTLAYLKEVGFWCVGLDGHTDKSLTDGVLESGDIALVLGAEGQGLRRLTLETCDIVAKIPITSAVESLNLSNAAAIALYEFARTR